MRRLLSHRRLFSKHPENRTTFFIFFLTYDLETVQYLKLRGFLISFSAANLCEAKNRYLLLRLGLLTNDIEENLVCPAVVD